MQIKNLLFSLFAASAAAQRTCGTPKPTEEQLQVAQNFQILENEAQAAGNSSRLAAATINVKIYWHVTATSNSVSGGYLTQATLTRQLQVLNTAFAPHGISFTQAGVDWTINSNWASDRDVLAMKRTLRKGTYADMNIYFSPSMSALGYAYLPTAVSAGSTAFIQDGVSIRSSTVPGGSETNYNLGHTATHEVGHWLGLLHTFEGACSGNGDFVSDTPFEASPASGCPTGRDSCRSQPGLDPIQNYMDYSYDPCFTNFSPGQEERMFSQWNAYRAGK